MDVDLNKSELIDEIDDDVVETAHLLSNMLGNTQPAGDTNGTLVINTSADRMDYGSDETHPTSSATARSPHKLATPTFVYVSTFLSAISGFLFGYDTGVVSGALILMRINFSLSPLWQEVIVSITMAAAAVFSLISGVANDWFGRKPTIVVASAVFTVGAILLGASQDRYMLLIGRLILGIGIGLASSTVPMYIAECAPSELRGSLVTINNIFITGGQFVASLIAGAFSLDLVNGWRFLFGLAAVPSAVQFVGFLFMPETPRWLITRGLCDKARAVLQQIHGPEFNVEQEMSDIENSVSSSSQHEGRCVIVKMLKVGHVRRALIVGCLLQLFQQITGINTVMYYSATIIEMSGVGNVSTAIWLAALTSAVNFLFSFVGLFLVDQIGRRPLTLGSLTGQY
jgi:SP family myo-inositol transporter-like MFS transporter 13